MQLAAQEDLDGVLLMHVEDWKSMKPETLSKEFMLSPDERKMVRDHIQLLKEQYRDKLFILSDV